MAVLRVCLILFLSHTLWAQTYTVETVPNVKVQSNNYVSNPDGILRVETVAEIDQKLRDLESRTSAQVTVVVIKSIGSRDIFNFSQELFTLWGIGSAARDNGLLVLLVLDQRTVRFHTGQGLEGMLPDVICKRIEMEKMIPEFKEGRNDAAMLSGVDEIIKVLTDPAHADEIWDVEARAQSDWVTFFPFVLVGGGILLLIAFLTKKKSFSDSKKPTPTLYLEMRLSKVVWIMEFGIVPAAIVLVFQFSPLINPIAECIAALYGYFMLTLIFKRIRMGTTIDRFLESSKYKQIVDFLDTYRRSWLGWGILFPVPFLPHYFLYLRRIRFYRNHPRNCESCGKAVRKLDELSDDNYLSKAQIFEEGLKSVDYDVWLCDSCAAYSTLVYTRTASAYSPCPKCKTRAFYLKSQQTIVAATESSTGKGERHRECKFCGHKATETYSIPKITKSSSGGSSSSSSGGSFGGGSSGGGGASSSW